MRLVEMYAHMTLLKDVALRVSSLLSLDLSRKAVWLISISVSIKCVYRNIDNKSAA